MIKVNSIRYHDKKRTKQWFTVMGEYNDIRFICTTETQKGQTKINCLNVAASITEEEGELIKAKGYKEDESLLERLTESEKGIIIESINNHLKGRN